MSCEMVGLPGTAAGGAGGVRIGGDWLELYGRY